MDLEEIVKNSLVANEITEPVKNVIVKDAGLAGEGMASQTKYITVEFQSADVKEMNLFAKLAIESESYTQMLDDMKAFEKESTFLTDYVSASDAMCKRNG